MRRCLDEISPRSKKNHNSQQYKKQMHYFCELLAMKQNVYCKEGVCLKTKSQIYDRQNNLIRSYQYKNKYWETNRLNTFKTLKSLLNYRLILTICCVK